MEKPFAITLDVGSSLANRTGAWRTSRPVYVDRLPPCNHACPAGENVQTWLFHAEAGDYETAWRALVEDNPLPAIMGRVCDEPCAAACHRGRLDEAVGIGALERFLGDEALKRGWKFAAPREETGKRVLVIGAGASGLSAAYHLRRRGHRVTLVEARTSAGGMMRRGIPKFQLPREVLDAEVGRIVDLGVALELGHRASDVVASMRHGRFDAAFLALGAYAARRDFVPIGGLETLEMDPPAPASPEGVDLSLLAGVPGLVMSGGAIEVGSNMMTGCAGIFASGDALSSERPVAVAVGEGKRAARHIDAWLRGGTYVPVARHELAAFEHLNPWYYADAPPPVRATLEPIRRKAAHEESTQGLGFDATNALLEARRCLSCGNCFECDNCYGVCPDNAVTKRGPGKRYEFNYDYCKGCGICVSECPCGAVRMVPETI